jgi:UDP-GlcNAc3NAcA epimerase
VRISTVVGARPQFVKAATVSRQIEIHNRRHPAAPVKETFIHTGQHFDDNMSRIFFDELELPKPDYNLGIGGGTHGQNTGRMIESIENVLLRENPDRVLVYGDTDSTLAGALAAVKLHIPVAHVEAGLRSFNRRMPEEINRVLTDHAADLLFAPTETAVENLKREGIVNVYPEADLSKQPLIAQVGDVMFDAALFYAAKAEGKTSVLQRLGLESKKYVLATIHRQENVDEARNLAVIVNAFNEVARKIPVVLPLHPRTRARLHSPSNVFSCDPQPSFIFIDPVGYLDMVTLEKHAAVIATDSGGVQKEAFFHEVPCVTLRKETEWLELVYLGCNTLVAPDSCEVIVEQILASISSSNPDCNEKPYGRGDSAARILEILAKCCGKMPRNYSID